MFADPSQSEQNPHSTAIKIIRTWIKTMIDTGSSVNTVISRGLPDLAQNEIIYMNKNEKN